MSDRILTLNAGSSSLKFALFEVAECGDLALVSRGNIEGREAAPILEAVDTGGSELADHHWPGHAKVGHKETFADHLGREARGRRHGRCRRAQGGAWRH